MSWLLACQMKSHPSSANDPVHTNALGKGITRYLDKTWLT